MNEMNSLETQLYSWRPRRPSAGLEGRLFGEPEAVRLVPRLAWFVGWLVPASACVLLTCAVFTSGNALPGRSFHRASLMAPLSSNQSCLAPVPENFQAGQNNLPSVTFDWTNRNGSTSAISAFQERRTN